MKSAAGAIWIDYSYDFADPVVVVPHANWRSAYETSTFENGSNTRCTTVWLPVSEGGTGTGTNDGPLGGEETGDIDPGADSTADEVPQTRCIERDFPGAYMGLSRELKRQTLNGPIAWMGSLVQDAQDASGLMYRRNRYYDPQTGKFTQQDPIGLAGGINA